MSDAYPSEQPRKRPDVARIGHEDRSLLWSDRAFGVCAANVDEPSEDVMVQRPHWSQQ